MASTGMDRPPPMNFTAGAVKTWPATRTLHFLLSSSPSWQSWPACGLRRNLGALPLLRASPPPRGRDRRVGAQVFCSGVACFLVALIALAVHLNHETNPSYSSSRRGPIKFQVTNCGVYLLDEELSSHGAEVLGVHG